MVHSKEHRRGRAGAWRDAGVHVTWTGLCRYDKDLGLFPERRVEGSGKSPLRGGEGVGQQLTMIFGTEWLSGCSVGRDWRDPGRVHDVSPPGDGWLW